MSTSNSTSWTPESWTSKPTHEQIINYDDPAHLDEVCTRLTQLPPLVTPAMIDEAREQCAAAAKGEAFLLLAGDCAENFVDVQDGIIRDKYALWKTEAESLEAQTGRRVHVFGRIAGQYAKPRSSLIETLPDGRKVHAFRGCNVNGAGVDERTPDPQRLLDGYLHAAVSMFSLSNIAQSEGRDVLTAHEALHLPFETSMTRGRYNVSAAMLWMGLRTQQADGAHLEYLRGLRNPIGVKVGPPTTAEDVLRILRSLHSEDAITGPGSVVLITRLGAAKVKTNLPSIVTAVRDSGYSVTWMCDPCHANTVTKEGVKTRIVSDMAEEVKNTVEVLANAGVCLGGLHLEQTGEVDVTECLADGSSSGGELHSGNYKSLCDPRLSRKQAEDLVRQTGVFMSRYGAQPPVDVPSWWTATDVFQRIGRLLMPRPQAIAA